MEDRTVDDLVWYRHDDGVSVITMDDNKVNVLSPRMLTELNRAFDRAESDRAVVILTGRAGVFSAGFDLKVLRGAIGAANEMLNSGFNLAERIINFPTPVIAACSGHAIAMGAFLSLSCDYRIGVEGEYRIVANEVALGMAMPRGIVELCRLRLSPAQLSRALTLAEPFSGPAAVAAGWFDELIDESSLMDRATVRARELAELNLEAYLVTKQRLRSVASSAIRRGFEDDARDRDP